jgi:hypothetical protein
VDDFSERQFFVRSNQMSQRSRSKKQTRKTSAPRPVENGDAVAQPLQVAPTSSTSRSFATDFNPDYSQTIKDLKRIGVLAGIFFGVLIVLAIVLP